MYKMNVHVSLLVPFAFLKMPIAVLVGGCPQPGRVSDYSRTTRKASILGRLTAGLG